MSTLSLPIICSLDTRVQNMHRFTRDILNYYEVNEANFVDIKLTIKINSFNK